MKKRPSFDGGVASVRVMPLGMKEGGDLSVPPPKTSNPAPKQFTIPETTFNEAETAQIMRDYQGPNRMTDTPGVFSAPNSIGGEMGMVYGAPGARQVFEDQMIMGRVIDPKTVYPNDPDINIMTPQITQPPQKGRIPGMESGIPQLFNIGLQNNGIMDIVEKLKITKPSYDI